MTEDQIKRMAERFLTWHLPESFDPDNGITFTPTYNGFNGEPIKRDPTGTDLFDYTQAVAMVRHMIEGLPD